MPYPAKGGHDVSLITTVLEPESGSQRTDLDKRILQNWRDEMILLAEPHSSLILNFNGVRAYNIDDWEKELEA